MEQDFDFKKGLENSKHEMTKNIWLYFIIFILALICLYMAYEYQESDNACNEKIQTYCINNIGIDNKDINNLGGFISIQNEEQKQLYNDNQE